ncbi:MAG: hypothetical protein NC048_00905 [Bacteroides sp.]|nr:hypothetical protein [Ruminococcus flavefaciens]MCM1554039.1 hypothetical protein [Bacteroides sp.]
MKNCVKAGLLGLLAMGLFAACEKEKDKTKEPVVEEYEKTLYFNASELDSVTPAVVQHFVNDPNCKKIYLSSEGASNLRVYSIDDMNILRNRWLEPSINLSPKVTGRGNILREPNTTYKSDSIWYVQNGWIIMVR